MSTLRTLFLLVLLTAILVWVGGIVGGRTGMIIALAIGLGLNLVNYWFSSTLVLKAYRARILGPDEMPELQADIREMAEKAGLPMPKVALVPNPAPNAFATGRNPEHAVVAVTEGIVALCDRRELRGVVGHELGHVRNRDMLTMTLVAGAVSAISMLAQMGFMFGGRRGDREGSGLGGLLMVLLAPLAATLVQMAISRTREYGADDQGAELSGDPGALADALTKLHQAIPQAPPLSQTGATAHMMIANPFFGISRLFSTHPDPAKRIARLRAMEAGR